jgi:hypothetical protein
VNKSIKIFVCALFAASQIWGATIKTSYRATNQSVTATLASLANSTSQSTGIRGSAFIDNTTNLDVDDQVTVQVTTGSSGVSSTGSVVIYAYSCVGGTTTCSDGVTGTDAGQTLTNPTNLVKVISCNTVANSTAYTCGSFSVANAFGGTVPARWGIVIQNLSGAALSATGNSIVYDALQMTSN